MTRVAANLPGYASVARASDVLHLARRSVRGLIYAGRLPSVRLGRMHFIKSADLESERRRRLGLPQSSRAPRVRRSHAASASSASDRSDLPRSSVFAAAGADSASIRPESHVVSPGSEVDSASTRSDSHVVSPDSEVDSASTRSDSHVVSPDSEVDSAFPPSDANSATPLGEPVSAAAPSEPLAAAACSDAHSTSIRVRSHVDPALRRQRAAERAELVRTWTQRHHIPEPHVPAVVLGVTTPVTCEVCGREVRRGRIVELVLSDTASAARLCTTCGRRALLDWADRRRQEAAAARRLSESLGQPEATPSDSLVA